MNQRALVTLGVLLGAAYGQNPQALLNHVHQELRACQSKEPANFAVMVVLVGAAAFYAAERGQNPKVQSYFDALEYVSTNLSVGYCDIFARTSIGKAIGSALMTYGPALAARALDPPRTSNEDPATDANLRVVADKLDQILGELVRQRKPTETSLGLEQAHD